MEFRPFEALYSAETGSLVVRGEIDELSGPALRNAIVESSERYTRPLTIDLSDVDFCPSLAVGILATAMQSGDIELVAKDGCIAQRVLEICGMTYRRV